MFVSFSQHVYMYVHCLHCVFVSVLVGVRIYERACAQECDFACDCACTCDYARYVTGFIGSINWNLGKKLTWRTNVSLMSFMFLTEDHSKDQHRCHHSKDQYRCHRYHASTLVLESVSMIIRSQLIFRRRWCQNTLDQCSTRNRPPAGQTKVV